MTHPDNDNDDVVVRQKRRNPSTVLLGTFRTMATRTYASVDRTFEITLSGTPAGSYSSWTVEHVYDKSINSESHVPGMDSIVASTEDAAFARTCDCIDKSLRSTF